MLRQSDIHFIDADVDADVDVDVDALVFRSIRLDFFSLLTNIFIFDTLRTFINFTRKISRTETTDCSRYLTCKITRIEDKDQ